MHNRIDDIGERSNGTIRTNFFLIRPIRERTHRDDGIKDTIVEIFHSITGMESGNVGRCGYQRGLFPFTGK